MMLISVWKVEKFYINESSSESNHLLESNIWCLPLSNRMHFLAWPCAPIMAQFYSYPPFLASCICQFTTIYTGTSRGLRISSAFCNDLALDFRFPLLFNGLYFTISGCPCCLLHFFPPFTLFSLHLFLPLGSVSLPHPLPVFSISLVVTQSK